MAGDGRQVFGSAQLITEIDTLVTAIGGLARFVNTGSARAARHVGWVALGLNGAPFSEPDKVYWWSYVEFESEGWVAGLPNFPVDLLAWHIEPGCAVDGQPNY